MDKVVYILGAGFSAPLGLPLIGSFIDKAKELYARDRSKYQHFGRVFSMIKQMSYLTQFFHADLENIEEVLSILQMEELLGTSKNRSQLERMICNTITHYTPRIALYAPRKNFQLGTTFLNQFISNVEDENWRPYLHFVASLFDLTVLGPEDENPNPEQSLRIIPGKPYDHEYSVITLNYDRVLETALEFILDNFDTSGTTIGFSKEQHSKYEGRFVPLAKLHGCVSDGDITPPTWNKYLTPARQKSWRLAYSLLKDANHVRIIGYSLPVSDAYVRFLLKSALNHTEHLKSIHVLCLDPDHSVEKSYGSFICHSKRYRFFNTATEYYLLAERWAEMKDPELAHGSFIEQYDNQPPF